MSLGFIMQKVKFKLVLFAWIGAAQLCFASPQNSTNLFSADFALLQGQVNWQKNKIAIVSPDVSASIIKITDLKSRSLAGIGIVVKKPIMSSASWVSDSFGLQGSDYLVVHASVSGENIKGGNDTWHRASVTIQFFDANSQYIGHDDIVRFSGNQNKETYKQVVLFPENASQARVIFGMVGATGKAILHSVSVKGKKFIQPAALPRSAGVVIPTPWKQECADRWIEIEYLDLKFKGADVSHTLRASVTETLREKIGTRKVQYSPGESERQANHAVFELFPVVDNSTLVSGDESKLNELNHTDGYRLTIDTVDGIGLDIQARASSERGLYYAAQSLRQLMRVSPDHKVEVRQCIIRDWPVLSLRGIAGGRGGGDYIKLLSSYKINELQISGAPGVWADWDIPATIEVNKSILAMGKAMQASFMNGTVAIWPGAYGNVFAWSNPDHRDVLLKKSALYKDAGFSSILLVFASDYGRVGRGDGILAEQDKDKNLMLSDAHNSLASHFYKTFKEANYPGWLKIFPYYYMGAREYGEEEIDYLRDMSHLPEQISFIYGGRISRLDIERISKYIGRRPLIRISTPGTAGMAKSAQDRNIYQLLEEIFSGLDPGMISGLVIEAPGTKRGILDLAEFMWNMGRTPY